MLLRLTFYSLLTATALTSCLTGHDKCTDPAPAASVATLQSRWVWQQSAGGIGGLTTTPASSGQQRAIEFDNSGVVRFYTNGQLTRTEPYMLTTGTSIRTGQSVPLIQYGNGPLRQSYEIQGQQLTLWDEAYDGFKHDYQHQPQ